MPNALSSSSIEIYNPNRHRDLARVLMMPQLLRCGERISTAKRADAAARIFPRHGGGPAALA